MQIGSVKLDNITILAPLAGITNLAFRILAKKQGCALVCSEMVSSNGLVHGSKKTKLLLKSLPEEKPLSVQIFGSDPFIMAEAAKMVELSGADIIDINLGCSVKKVLKTGCDAVMIGRASIGNPWIFSQVLDRIKGNDISSVSLLDRYNVMVDYLESSIKFFGEKTACFMMRSKLGWFTKGLPDSSRFRDSLKHTSSEDEAKNIIEKYFDSLKKS